MTGRVPRRVVPLVLAGLAGLAVLVDAGCAGGGAGGRGGARTDATLRAANSSRYGTIVVDRQGFTVYRFDRDSASPPASSCTGDCAAQWPPVLASGPVTGAGIGAARLGTLTRPDGTAQVTLAGWPLYRFAGDGKPGETKGEGVLDAWYVVTPNGVKVTGSEGEDTGGNGY